MDRRQFLGFSAVSAFLTACGGGSAGSKIASSSVVEVPPAPTVVSKLSAEQWQGLSEQLNGELILPTNVVDYSQERLVFHTRFDHIYPQAVAKCRTTDDVIAVLSFVKQHDLHIVPRSGRHGYAGYSTTEGVVLDVSQLNSISIDDGYATIGAGARLVNIYDQLTNQSVCIPAGTCLSVGIAGLTLGGGFSVIGRAHGLTCDVLESAQIVTAQGELLTCNNNENSDLFWALRGGGGGNFGIVTSFVFRTHKTQDINVFEASFSFNDFEQLMSKWQVLAQSWPDEMWAQCLPNWINGSVRVTVRAFCLNQADEARSYWEQFIAAVHTSPLSNNESTESYRDIMLGNCVNNIPSCHLSVQSAGGRMQRSAFGASSDFFEGIIPPSGIKTLKGFIEKSINEGKYGMIIFNLLGGAIKHTEVTETAYPHRRANISAEYYAPINISSTNEQIDETQKWQNQFREIMAPWSTGGAYVNYMDPLILDWQQAYYAGNYYQLQKIKSKYDPEEMFNFTQSVELA
ncbi:hypothetical protein BGP78_05730 [Pseudoalteromonas sp. MSK9-3]|uniref:FAD-binding oxidoreductase n=1 Tax=Pseudoalteromonas sp. MSK9-3 TaxID=1897633 RepID=UPI000E6C61B9|nr:FAD-dependent oxidoreductase [Pseudoalteromonas sp. MSK9-3]RJE78189.1 hypothetical protein BGP78_05730 [Pseudoalteromonas sp. MSK9-3]